MDLLGKHPDLFVVTEGVAKETIHPDHPRDMHRYNQALKDRHLIQASPTIEEINIQEKFLLGIRIHTTVLAGKNIGLGERSIIAFALNRNCTSLATDDQEAADFVNEINDIFDQMPTPRSRIRVLGTQQIMQQLYSDGNLIRKEANTIRDAWNKKNRFELNTTFV